MADLDSASKRSSSVQMLVHSLLSPVFPDGTIDSADMAQTIHMYSGIAAATPSGRVNTLMLLGVG